MLAGMNAPHQTPVDLREMARRLRVPAKWLKEEALAGRVPHLVAGSTFLFDPIATERAILKQLHAREEGSADVSK